MEREKKKDAANISYCNILYNNDKKKQQQYGIINISCAEKRTVVNDIEVTTPQPCRSHRKYSSSRCVMVF